MISFVSIFLEGGLDSPYLRAMYRDDIYSEIKKKLQLLKMCVLRFSQRIVGQLFVTSSLARLYCFTELPVIFMKQKLL